MTAAEEASSTKNVRNPRAFSGNIPRDEGKYIFLDRKEYAGLPPPNKGCLGIDLSWAIQVVEARNKC